MPEKAVRKWALQIPREEFYQGKKIQCKGPGSVSQRAWVRSSEEAMWLEGRHLKKQQEAKSHGLHISDSLQKRE